jgi:peptide-methionine (S)-S-oxide reductase
VSISIHALGFLAACMASLGFSGSRDKPPATDRGLFRTKSAPKILPKTEIATFAAGCCWGVEQEFRKLQGVVATAVGYMGGHTKNPTYEQVCSHTTGHAEVVQVEFDPKAISYGQLLSLFWDLHDPTTLNRQGPDVGDQYRSAVYFHTPQQKAEATASRDKLQKSGELKAPIVTEITAAGDFTFAEDYHQQYVEKGGAASCHWRRSKAR